MTQFSEDPMAELLAVMARLRHPQSGCPWDLQQTPQTIAPYTLEETYEVLEAIESGTPQAMCEELGDLLLQIVFYAQMAHEQGWFNFSDVAAGITQKLRRRHPHVFGPTSTTTTSVEAVQATWEAIKAQARAAKASTHQTPPESVLSGIPTALPALARAQKLADKAAVIGFDWPDWQGARDKVIEELREVEEAIRGQNPAELNHEMGDLIQATANLARKLGLDAEQTLRAANRRFEQRFRAVERGVHGRTGVTLEEMEALWQAAKHSSAD